jgi:hypothetical protein
VLHSCSRRVTNANNKSTKGSRIRKSDYTTCQISKPTVDENPVESRRCNRKHAKLHCGVRTVEYQRILSHYTVSVQLRNPHPRSRSRSDPCLCVPCGASHPQPFGHSCVTDDDQARQAYVTHVANTVLVLCGLWTIDIMEIDISSTAHQIIVRLRSCVWPYQLQRVSARVNIPNRCLHCPFGIEPSQSGYDGLQSHLILNSIKLQKGPFGCIASTGIIIHCAPQTTLRHVPTQARVVMQMPALSQSFWVSCSTRWIKNRCAERWLLTSFAFTCP